MNRLIQSIAALALCAFAATARAQAWPDKPVQIMVGYAAGTGIDSVARFYADKLREATSKPFVVVNKVGAYGNLAAADVARARPDGYTLLITPNTPITVNAHILKDMPFDPARELLPVATLTRWGMVLLVNPKSPVTTVAELSALMKKSPGKLNYASGNFAGRAAAELYRIAAGLDGVHVAYKSVPAAVTDLLGGQVDFMFADVVAGLPHARSGRLRALAVTTPRRLDTVPDIPTMAEAGVANADVVSWFAALAPAGTPGAIVDQLGALLNGITTSDAAKEYFARIGAEPFVSSQRDLAGFISAESRRWGELVRATKIEKE
jgi:tripartite-type tricarboxylate transporter receptor subunit TctC